jgi:acetyl-CoA C-acetyltransferase
MAREAVIVGAARTPVGRARGKLAAVPAHLLGAIALREAVKRSGLDPNEIEEVIFGNLFANEYANISRNVTLEAGLPYDIPAITVDRQCASSLSALVLAAALIQSGQADVVAAGGVESDSRRTYVMEKPTQAYQTMPPRWAEFMTAPAKEDCVSMVETAENVAKKFNISRDETDAFAAESHKKAVAAWDAGRFESQIAAVEAPAGKGKTESVTRDESMRPDTTKETLAALRPVLPSGAVVTAGNSSPMNDGAGALIVMEKEKAKALGLAIMGKFVAGAAAGLDPKIMGYGPVVATEKLLKKTGRALNDIDLIEMNEAFATQSVACIKGLNIDVSKLNVNGGAIALGHPLAGTGAILVTKLLYEMERRGAGSGLVTFCIGGGQGASVIIERE